MTRTEKYLEMVKNEKDTLTYSEREEIVNYIYQNYFDESAQRKEDYFEEGWKYGHGYGDDWLAMEDFLYYEFAYTYEDVLRDMKDEEEWGGLK